MKWILLCVLSICTCNVADAQQLMASLSAENAEKKIYLKDWDIDIKIIGNIAVTTQKMIFYNPNNRILEGEFNFPLNAGQTVSRFAMDFSGVLREGSIVDKEKGRQTFEKIVRQNVDPGLLEMTKGNNFRARVYPIPSKGTKTIVIAYEQELKSSKEGALYSLPTGTTLAIPSFHFKTTILKHENKPKWLNNESLNLSFEKNDDNYTAEIKQENFKPSASLSFIIPFTDKAINYLQDDAATTYFYTYQKVDTKTSARTLPKSLTVLWDVSMSRTTSNLVKEITFLTLYLQKIKNASVDLITFSNSIHSTASFTIINGNTSEISKTLLSLAYDGGTQYGMLDLSKYHTDEILLFTDGISNFGKQKIIPNNSSAVLYVINANTVADHDYLKNMAESNKGQYLNLVDYSEQKAAEKIASNISFIQKIEVTDGVADEIYPKVPCKIDNGLSLSGILLSEKATLKITINKNGIIEEKIITLSKSDKKTDMIQRVWANKKLDHLLKEPDKNSEAIKALGLKYSIVTPGTSLIVLDNIDDYVRYEIVPPADMQKEYWKKMAAKVELEKSSKKTESEQIKEQISRAKTDLLTRVSWWNKDFVTSYSKYLKDKEQAQVNIPYSNSTPSNVNYNNPLVAGVDTKTIHGTVKDVNGEALIGVTVVGKGTTYGCVTDIDGNYIITLPRTTTSLVYNYIGYSTIEKPILSLTINATLQADNTSIEEVVVTGMSVRRESRSISYSVNTVTSENYNVVGSLQGKVAGLKVSKNKKSKISSSDRWKNDAADQADIDEVTDTIGLNFKSLKSNKKNKTYKAAELPLYVLNKKIVTIADINALNQANITSIQVLDSSEAISIYGEKAKYGAIIISTEKDTTKPSLFKKIENEEQLAVFIDSLKKLPVDQQYVTYLKIKVFNEDNFAFYIDVANYFYKANQKEIALRILSNIAELELENHELMRAMAYVLESWNEVDYALDAYAEVLKIKGEEPQSHRDYAIAFAEKGSYQQAADILYSILTKKWENNESRFAGIQGIIINELNYIIALSDSTVNTTKMDTGLLKALPVDFRTTIDWNKDNTDIDLHIVDPVNEECFYSHKETLIGGRISNDFTGGYGPEEFLIKKAYAGNYVVKIHYYGDRLQEIRKPTIVKTTTFKHYGNGKPAIEISINRLNSKGSDLVISNIVF